MGLPKALCWASITSFFMLSLLITETARAQALPSIDDRNRELSPGRSRPSLPDLDAPQKPAFELPPVPPKTEKGRAASGVRVAISGIDFEGNTVFSDQELLAIAAPYIDRKIATSELLELRDVLTRHYIERGYVNSGAVIPDQTIDRGRISIRIVEGRLNEIVPLGLTRLDPTFVRDRVGYGLDPVLNVNPLRERIELLLLDPSIRRLDARLNPGARPGESRLLLEIDETPPHRMQLIFANDRSPSVGAERGDAIFTYVNPSGRSDLLSLGFGLSEGTRDLSLSYDTPLRPDDLRAFLYGSYGRTEVVEEPFNAIDIESETLEVETGLSLPLIRSTAQELRFDASLTHKRSKTFLLDQLTSFSRGVEDGRSTVTALRLRQDWRLRGRKQALSMRSTMSFGFDAFDATKNEGDVPDGQFAAWLGQAQFARRLGKSGLQATLRGDVQLTPDSLLAIERIGIGGGDTVRGYRENELVFDNGWVVSAGLQVPVGRLALPGTAKTLEDGRIALVPFVDAGGGWNNDGDDGGINEVVSIGVGADWKMLENTSFRLDVGLPLIDTDSPEGDDLQDFGIHFRLSTTFGD